MAGAGRKKQPDTYSYADYRSWGDDYRCELIDGRIYDMNAAPARIHQEITGDLFGQFWQFLQNRPCRVYAAPFDVRLARPNQRDDQVFTVVQPDITVVCDEDKLDDFGCIGAPDLIVEVISPSTASKDNVYKRAVYERTGVREFWLVNPGERWVRVCHLAENGLFGPEAVYDDTGKVQVGIFPELTIDLAKIFPPLPPENAVRTPPPPAY